MKRFLAGYLPGMVMILLMADCTLAQTVAEPETIGFSVQGSERSILLYRPASTDGSQLPLVFNLHGSGGTAERQDRFSGMSGLLETEKFLLAGGTALYEYPEGRLTWNADLDPNGVSDVDYILAAIEAIGKVATVDRNRIYVTGMSGGGRMSSRLACELADTLAAIAPVAGIQFARDCSPSQAIPIITFHSTDDVVNTYAKGNEERNPNWVRGVEPAIEDWVKSNGCDGTANEEAITGEIMRIAYQGCENGAELIFYRLEDGNHTWPGTPIFEELAERRGVRANMDISATELIWEFFERHSLE